MPLNKPLAIITMVILSAFSTIYGSENDWPLHSAISDENEELSNQLINSGIDIQEKDDTGYTPLHIAIICRQPKLALRLIELGADVNRKSRNGDTPLEMAIARKDLELCKALLLRGATVCMPSLLEYAAAADFLELMTFLTEQKTFSGDELTKALFVTYDRDCALFLLGKGANVNSKDDDDNTLLHFAVGRKDFECAERFIQCGAMVDAVDQRGETPLHYACASGNLDIVELLLKEGANCNARNFYEQTPLFKACSIPIAQLLLSQGADIHAQDFEGNTALAYVMYHRTDSNLLAAFLIDVGIDIQTINNYNGCTPLAIALVQNNHFIAQKLIAKGASLLSKDASGRGMLHLAAEYASPFLVKLLIEKGLDVNAKDHQGSTPLHAAFNNYCGASFETVKMLIENGSDCNAKNEAGETPFLCACGEGKRSILEYLIQKGANIHAFAEDGFSPLHRAVSSQSEASVELLLQRGAEVNSSSKSGITPLMMGVSRGNLYIVEQLLNAGAHANAKDCEGWTPNCMALTNQYGSSRIDMIRLLVAHGADLLNVDEHKRTLLHLFVMNNWQDETLLRKMLDAGVNPNAQDDEGLTALDYAIMNGTRELYQTLDGKTDVKRH